MTHNAPAPQKEYTSTSAFTLYATELAVIDRVAAETKQNRSAALRQIIQEWDAAKELDDLLDMLHEGERA